ncbi:MAG: SsrA-binding protein SmpB [Acidimicrobiia bacterium]|nr:SsrA-binding protein SmpB [Acidimicrobiia bacterium]
MATRSDDARTVVATNRQARRDYDILETLEVGIALRGSEVKSLRAAKVQLADAHAKVRDHELWLHGLHISPWESTGTHDRPEPDRARKLLAHRVEIDRLRARVDQERLALVPMSIYFRDGRAKIDLAVARGRSKGDKRRAIAERDAAAEARRAMGRRAKGMD